MTDRKSNGRDWEYSLEQELIRYSEEQVVLRPTLRRQVLNRATAAYRRGRFIARVQMAVASVLFLAAGLLCTDHYLSLWQGRFQDGAVAQQVTDLSAAPADDSSAVTAASVKRPRELILFAMSQTDDWAIVDAYGALRSHRFQVLQNALWH